MALKPGAQIGGYEIVDTIGAGGMGEVYRARDAKLNRDVAIKVLPDAFLADADRLARFKREAQVLAALNHPNVGAIYGFEDGAGAHALILEFVAGPTLADRIAQGATPIEEALPIARQIAEALETAHDQGIVHRDLKPANIKLRPDGIVKVLDFGLAKAFEPAGAVATATISPTITSPAMTQMGVILGTAAYMSPEQAKGRPADARSDIWAFGCVLYEMLSGKRPFAGEDVGDTLAAVIRGEPDWSALPADTPAHVRTLLRRCLQKDPRKRLPHIGVARLEIDDGPSAPATMGPPIERRRAKIVWIGLAAAMLAAIAASAITAAVMRRSAQPTTTAGMQRLTITSPTAAFIPISGDPRSSSLAISPDGSRIVYTVSAPDGSRSLYLRFLDQLDPRALPGTENGVDPVFSPDGEEIAFFVVDATASLQVRPSMKKIAVRGVTPATLAASLPGVPAGATWTADGRIVFALGSRSGGPATPLSLFVIPSAGGAPRPLRESSSGDVRVEGDPHALPDGRNLLVSIRTGPSFAQAHIDAMSLDGRTVRTVIENGYHGRYAASGHIVYMSGNNLMAAPFDAARLEVTGPPAMMAENVRSIPTSLGDAAFDVSRTGVLVYGMSPSGPGPEVRRRTMTWVDRKGREEAVPAPPRAYMYPRISPDGTQVAVDARDEGRDIWTWDFGRRIPSRVTTDPAQDYYPVWSPDGRRLAFSSTRSGTGGFNLYSQNADGTGAVERLTEAPNTIQAPFAITPDGKHLIFRDQDQTGDTGRDLMMVSLDERPAPPKQRTIVALVRTKFDEDNGEISPNGRWLAYQSNESGQDEVYVRPFPETNSGRWTISSGGGTRPVWARNGRELFYLVGNSPNPVRIMRVPVETTNQFSANAPEVVFEGPYFAEAGVGARGRVYDVSPDGRRFLMLKDVEREEQRRVPQPLVVVLNWQELFKPRATR